MTTKNMTRSLLGALVVLMLGACGGGGNVEVKGRVSDDSGQQRQGLNAPALGGQGTVSAATEVKAYTVGAGGQLSALTSAKVNADATYSLQIPEGTEKVVIQAVDANGQVVASALLDAATTAEGQTARTAPTMSSETSLEAEVFQKMAKDGVALEKIDTVDLRSRIDAKTAEKADQQSSGAQEKTIAALASAVQAAQEAEIKAYKEHNVETSQQEIYQASLDASAKLDAALAAAGSGANQAFTQAYNEFFTAIQKSTSKTSETQESDAERASSASFRAVIDARLSLSFDTQAAADAASRSAAQLEAWTANVAVQTALKAAGAADATIAKAQTAYLTLSSALASGANTATAWDNYSLSIAGNTNASVLGEFLQVGATGSAELKAVQQNQIASATGQLENSVLSTLETLGSILTGANVTLLVDGMVKAFDTYSDAVRTGATSTLQAKYQGKTSAAVEVLVVANGHAEI